MHYVPRLRTATFALGLIGLPIATQAQFVTPAPAAAATPATAPQTFDFQLGSHSGDGATYLIKATAPGDSPAKSQRVRFVATVPTASGTTTRYFTVNTGKYKTVGQTTAFLRDVFLKFLAGAPANAELAKIGDIKYGGEIHFIVDSPEALRYDTLTAGEPAASMLLPRAEVGAYAAILGGGAAAR